MRTKRGFAAELIERVRFVCIDSGLEPQPVPNRPLSRTLEASEASQAMAAQLERIHLASRWRVVDLNGSSVLRG